MIRLLHQASVLNDHWTINSTLSACVYKSPVFDLHRLSHCIQDGMLQGNAAPYVLRWEASYQLTMSSVVFRKSICLLSHHPAPQV